MHSSNLKDKKKGQHSKSDVQTTDKNDTVMLQGPEVWKRVCAQLSLLFDTDEYNKWIATLRFLADVDGTVLIVARTQFAFDRVHAQYKRLIQRAWQDTDPRGRPVRLECWSSLPSDLRELSGDPWADNEELSASAPAGRGESSQNMMGPGVMRFDTLVMGTSNMVAVKVAEGIAAGQQSVPASVIVINGQQGVGKTHLMRAIETSLGPTDNHKVAYISAEDFLVAYVEGAMTGDTRALKARVREADIVLFDDLQTIAGKKGTNNELAGTIRAVSERGGIVILTADRPLADMQGLSAGVMTVLKGAACVEITDPDHEMRFQIVRQRADMLAETNPNFRLDDTMCDAIVARIHGPGRDLCGALISLYTETGLGEVAPTMEMLDRVLSRQQKPRPVTMDMVKRSVCRVFDMSKSDLEGERKFQRFVRARQVGMYLAREMTSKSFPQIGISFGDRHHTTALYAWRQITKKEATTPDLRADIEQVKHVIAQLQSGVNS